MKTVTETYVFTWKKHRYSSIEFLISSMLFLSVCAIGIFLFMYGDILKQAQVEEMSPRFLIFLVILVFHYANMKFLRSARLIVDSSGVRLEQSHGSASAILKLFERKALWAELKNVSYISAFQIIHLRSKPMSQALSIRVKDWQLEKTGGTLHARDAELDLIKFFRELEVFESFPKNRNLDSASFDLSEHSATKNLLLVMGCLVAYSFIDVMLQHEGYAFFDPVPHVTLGVFATIIVAYLLYKARIRDFIPSGIILILALMGGMTCGIASYVAGIRINQLAGGPLLEARYHRDTSCLNLLPEDKNLPVVEYGNIPVNYWCSKRVDEVLLIKVRKGLFGSYQFDLREQTQAIRDHKNP
ncbi:hypothetical protein ACO0LF_09935 [Undibacterium sp. Di27W]